MEIGIIGLGRLGKLALKFLGRDFSVKIYDQQDLQLQLKSELNKPNIQWSSLQECASCPIVLTLVPISQMENLLKKITTYLRPDAIVIDACSVKEYPLELMNRLLPPTVTIIGTHPLFGPDSIKDTLFGAKIVLCPVRGPKEKAEGIKKYLQQAGLVVIEVSAEQHDRDIGRSLALTHFIGRGLVGIKAQEQQIDTKGYRRLMRILETVVNDSWQLFEDMNHYNRFAKEIRNDFIKALQELDQKVESSMKGPKS
jgi:prephenate dehydrogenase